MTVSNKNNDYTIRFAGDKFDLHFVIDDQFYDAQTVAITIRELVIESRDSFTKNVKIVCRNKFFTHWNAIANVNETNFLDLAIAEITCKGREGAPQEKLVQINSVPWVPIPVIGRRLSFELKEAITGEPFTNFEKAIIRMGISFLSS